jgi:hypothetical protein
MLRDVESDSGMDNCSRRPFLKSFGGQLRQLPETQSHIAQIPPIWACDTAGGFTPGKNLSWWSYVKFYAEGESGTIREYCGILKVIYCLRPITWYHIAKQRSHQVVCHVFLGGNSLVMPSSTSGPHCACERRVLGWVGIEITDSRKSRTLE